jgi:mannose-6-phosphate isomerase
MKIKGVVQHYTWGGYNFIPQLLNEENKEQKPFAEYWLGAHPNSPSVLEKEKVKLSEFIPSNPSEILGETAVEKFSTLPFLFKVLDVRQMLSIQVHPSKESAVIGFAEENQKNIPLTAGHRNYKDENHKPELMVALSDFWLLHGFKKEDQIRETLGSIPEFAFLMEDFEKQGYKGLYEEVMNMSQERVNAILGPLMERITPLYKNNEFKKDQEDFWAARAALSFCKNNDYDRGIFSVYFFNLVHLKRGEGIFQPQGMPHAYLEGQNVEVMANSDNVLRAGLTDKHIDVGELMKHVHFEATVPNILNGSSSAHKVFFSPAEEFELHQYHLEGREEVIETKSAEIWFATLGTTIIKTETENATLSKGEGLFVIAGTKIFLQSSNSAELFRVVVPDVTKNRLL